MARTLTAIGILLATLVSAYGLTHATVARADTSPSFMLYSDFPNAATPNGKTSTNFQMTEDNLTWYQTRGTSTNFQIVPALAADAASSASSAAQSSSSVASGGGDGGGGGQGGCRGSACASSTGPAASSAGSSQVSVPGASSASSSLRPAAGSSSARSASQSSSVKGPIQSSSASTVSASSFSGGSSSASSQSDSSQGADVAPICPDPTIIGSTSTSSSSTSTQGTPEVTVCPSDLQTSRSSVSSQDRGTGVLSLCPSDLKTVMHGAGIEPDYVVSVGFWLMLIAITLIAILIHWYRKRRDRKKKSSARRKTRLTQRHARLLKHALIWLSVALLIIAALYYLVPMARAATSAPQNHVYNGRLLDASGNPVTTAHTIRFSYWNSADLIAGDVTATGAINVGSVRYANWTETQTVTPDSKGYFSVSMGSVTALPNVENMSLSTLLSLYLQVEVKASAAANTAYEVLDPNNADTTVDRSSVLSVPFALNADKLDRRDIGTGSGSIPLLQSGGVLPTSATPAGTNSNFFTIDADSTAATSITLKFGETLAKTLTYDIVNSRFTFNSSVRVEGNLTVTGLINGVDVSTLATSSDRYLRVSSGAGLSIVVSAGSYRINGTMVNFAGTGSMNIRNAATNYIFLTSTGVNLSVVGYPATKSFLPLAEVLTSGGTIQSVTDRRILSSDNREEAVQDVLHPEFKNASLVGDETSNVGQLMIANDSVSLRNYYSWTSTRTTLQDYDIVVKYRLPAQFIRWTNGIYVTYRSTTALSADNALEVQVYDTAGAAVTLTGTPTNLASTAWTTAQFQFQGTPTWTAGQDITIKFKVSAKNNEQIHLGALQIDYRKFNSQ